MFSRLRTTLLPGWIGCAPSGAQSSLALVQRPADGPPVVRWLASADWTRPTETLRQLKRGRELHRHRRVALLQNAQYQCVSLDAPTDLPREEWAAAVRWQLKDSVDFPVDTAAVDLLTVAEGTSYRTQPQLIVVAAPAESVRPLMQQGLQAKTPWDAIDIAETALRNLSALCEPENRAQALLHCQADHSTLVVTYQGELLFARRMDLSLEQLAHADDVTRTAANDHAVLQLQRTLDGFERSFGQVTLARLLIAPMPGQAAFIEHLAPLLYVSVEALALGDILNLDQLPPGSTGPDQLNPHVCAIGAALRDD
jgi:MSHA biogenesis protein MshI